MSEDVKVVSSILYTQGSEDVNEKVAGDLKVPDPDAIAAQASIDKFSYREASKVIPLLEKFKDSQ